jgi:Rod binding domain-containing protein
MLPTNLNPTGMQPFDAREPSPKAARSTQAKQADSPTERKLKKAAGDFESILLASLWKSMKQSFGKSQEAETDPAHGMVDDWSIEVMAGAVGKAGGLGIGKLILKHLEPAAAASDGPQTTPDTKVSQAPADNLLEKK